jgi:hypothetical protein
MAAPEACPLPFAARLRHAVDATVDVYMAGSSEMEKVPLACFNMPFIKDRVWELLQETVLHSDLLSGEARWAPLLDQAGWWEFTDNVKYTLCALLRGPYNERDWRELGDDKASPITVFVLQTFFEKGLLPEPTTNAWDIVHEEKRGRHLREGETPSH